MTIQHYEPEGIYLGQLTEPGGKLVQQWGDKADYFSQYSYNGIPLNGYFGLGFQIEMGSSILATDTGKVTEISIDEGGLDKYIKIDHWWGESIYALLGKSHITSGQTIERGMKIATSGITLLDSSKTSRFHFSIRIHPYNRFDGWGGYSDPLPYMDPKDVVFISDVTLGSLNEEDISSTVYQPLNLQNELPYMRRP